MGTATRVAVEEGASGPPPHKVGFQRGKAGEFSWLGAQDHREFSVGAGLRKGRGGRFASESGRLCGVEAACRTHVSASREYGVPNTRTMRARPGRSHTHRSFPRCGAGSRRRGGNLKAKNLRNLREETVNVSRRAGFLEGKKGKTPSKTRRRRTAVLSENLFAKIS